MPSSPDLGTLMWSEACELLERAERLHRQFFQLGVAEARRPTWEPPVDMFETEHHLCILVALPGITIERLEVLVQDGSLLIAAERPMPVESHARIHRLEIPHGRFGRRIALPPGRYEIGERELANGCLTLSLRKLT